MISYLILGLILVFCVYILLRWFAQATPQDVFRVLKWLLFCLVLVAIVFLALSGKLGLAFAALPALFVWFGRLRIFMSVIRMLRGFFGMSKPNPSGTGQNTAFEGVMSHDEALAILGLDVGALPQEIKAAYHRLISQAHPDKGGSDYLAAKINQARDVLLND